MSFMVSDSGGFKQLAAGVYPARCVRVIGIGTQHGEYQGKPNSRVQTIISWEFPTELIPEGDYKGQPYMLSKFYTHSLGEKANLRKHLVSWRGRDFTPEELKGFDLANIVGKSCMISVVHDTKGKARVDSIMALPKGIVVPAQINPSVVFNVYKWDQDVFNSLSDGIKELIKKSDEWKYMNGGSAMQVSEVFPNSHEEGDIPF